MTITRRQKLIGSISGGVFASVLTLVLVLGGPPSLVPHRQSTSTAKVLLWLYAPRDMGRLPARADWCTGSTHCWMMQETAGATQLADAAGAWTLDASGTPRAGVATSLPVEDATGWVDFSSELSTHTDGQSASGTGSWFKAAQTQSATNLVSVSAVIMPVYRQAQARILYSHRATADGTGYEVGVATDGTLYATVENSDATTLTVKTAATWDDGAWHAVTWVLDGRTASAARIYVDGTDATAATKTLATGGSWATTGPARFGADEDGANIWPGGIARLRVTVGAVDVAATYSGTLWGFDPQAAAVVAAGDIAWSQSGGVRCYQQSATTALCAAGGRPGVIWDSGLSGGRSMAWPVEPSGTNRVWQSSDLCAATSQWVVTGTASATCNAAISPTGAKSATTISVSTYNSNDVRRTNTGYANSTAVNLSFWLKCSSGTLRVASVSAGTGDWSINCATVAGVWTRIHAGHAAVSVAAAFVTSATGTIRTYWSGGAGVTADLWGVTITEAAGSASILTRSASVATGAISWTIDNAPAAYYSGSCGKLALYGSWVSGGCLDVYSPGDGGGRQFFDGAHWSLANSDATPIGVANLVPSGVDLLSFRWNSSAALSGGVYAEVLRDGAAQTWDTTPLAAWTGESPTAIHLGDYNGTTCRAAIQSVQIWDKP